jgi:TRAP-type transport system periplasmic protein
VIGLATVITLRLATAAPDGTTWAHELKALDREVQAATHGEVKIKWYWGGIAGDEPEMQDRISRGQLDGMASGGVTCHKVSATMRVLAIRGMFHTRDEAAHVMTRLRPQIEDEARDQGFEYVGATGLGPDLVFSRNPIKTWDELTRTKLWVWNVDDATRMVNDALGFSSVALPINDALRAYDEGKIDAFLSAPQGAVAFQWFSRARYLLNQPLGFSWGCLLIASKAMNRLPHEHQQVLRTAANKAGVRIDAAGRQADSELLGGLFEKQGLKPITGSDSLRRDFLAAARAARDKLGAKLVSPPILQRVLALLADYRSEHTEPTN